VCITSYLASVTKINTIYHKHVLVKDSVVVLNYNP
jgi:hypothetical protein